DMRRATVPQMRHGCLIDRSTEGRPAAGQLIADCPRVSRNGPSPRGCHLEVARFLLRCSVMRDVARALRDKAKVGIVSGSLPTAKPNRVWGGPGAGFACAVCGVPIERQEIEFELQFVVTGAAEPAVYRFHTACHAAWELERDSL